jgi:hydrogenase maturation protein HypF
MSLETDPSLLTLNWQPALERLAEDLAMRTPVSAISARFHNALSEGICAVAAHFGCKAIALTGGCFQNKRLFEETWRRLQTRGFHPYGAQRIPPGDGGLAFGQLAATRNGWGQARQIADAHHGNTPSKQRVV